MKNYNSLIGRVKQRSNPNGSTNLKAVMEGLGIPYSDLSEYVKLAMVGVPQEYTKKSIETANYVVDHLKRSHGSEVDFRFQGSVPANTHVLSEHDVDVVQISKACYGIPITEARILSNDMLTLNLSERINVKRHVESYFPYSGNSLHDLYALRIKSENVLKAAYQHVDTSKAKAICVNIQKPIRNVDIVTAQEYRGIRHLKSNNSSDIGIRVYNKELHAVLPEEYPFLSIERINKRGNDTNDRFKKMIRFLKNLKLDATEIIGRKPEVSSFDIYAICYDIPVLKYISLSYMELLLVIHEQLRKIVLNEIYRNGLMSVDGEEEIFLNKPEKVQEIKFLLDALETLMTDARTLKLVN